MDVLKQEYFKLVPLYQTARERYESVIRELQHVDILLKTDWAKHLIEETANEWLEYKERIEDICAEIDRETLCEWGKEYAAMLVNIEFQYMN